MTDVLLIICLLLAVALVCVGIWGFEQREKRLDAEGDVVIERGRNRRLRNKVPFGEPIKTNQGRKLMPPRNPTRAKRGF